VPPPQTGVNLGLVSNETPAVAWFNVYGSYAEVEFTKYMKPETMRSLVLKAPDGGSISYALEYSRDEQSADGKVYAKRYKLNYGNGYTASAGSYSLVTDASITSYANIPAKAETRSAILTQPVSLAIPENIEVDYGAEKDIIVSIENYDPSNPAVLTAEAEYGYIARVVSVSGIGSDGRATIRVLGIMPGPENIIIRIADRGIEATLPVWVNMPGEASRILISPITANIGRGETQQFTATESIGGNAAAVTWSVSGNISANTSISASGLLTVAEDETAEELTITAVSIDDSGKFSTAAVNITKAYLLGDVDGINGIMITDYITLRRWLAGWSGVVINESAADVDGVNGVTMADAIRLRRYLAGWAGYELN
jgi:hypothetical protein